jgi:hypothetical protein
MSRPRLEVADIIRSAGAHFLERNRLWLRWTHLKVLLGIARCRTAALETGVLLEPEPETPLVWDSRKG